MTSEVHIHRVQHCRDFGNIGKEIDGDIHGSGFFVLLVCSFLRLPPVAIGVICPVPIPPGFKVGVQLFFGDRGQRKYVTRGNLKPILGRSKFLWPVFIFGRDEIWKRFVVLIYSSGDKLCCGIQFLYIFQEAFRLRE